MLSPFETYDLLFVRDTVNNLNKDNEVLSESIQDLKGAFIFVVEKHKELLRKYKKEMNNKLLISNYEKRLQDLSLEHEKTH